MEAYAGFKKGGFLLPNRLHAVGHRWTMERHDLMAAAWWPHADQRTEAKHTRDDRADADPASARNGAGRHTLQARQKERSAERLLFDFAVRHDARSGAQEDL